MGFLKKIFKGVGNVAKKVLPLAAVAAPFIPGVGSLVGGAVSKLFGSSESSAPAVPATDPGVASLPGKEITGSKPPIDWGGAIGAIGTGAMSLYGQQQTNAANAKQAQAQMDFQAQQTSTAYQRGTADMQAAGLNPMLAYSQGGASSGSGAMATMGNELGQGASSAVQTAQTLAAVKNMFAQTEKTGAETDLTEATTRRVDTQRKLDLLMMPKVEADTATSRATAKQVEQARENAAASLSGIQAESELSGLQLQAARNRQGYAKTWVGRHVSPVLDDVGKVVSGARDVARMRGGY